MEWGAFLEHLCVEHLEHFWSIFASFILLGIACKSSNHGNNVWSQFLEVISLGVLWNQLGKEIEDDKRCKT